MDPFEMPDDVAALSDAEIRDLLRDARATLAAIVAGERTVAALDEARAMRANVEALADEVTRRQVAAEEWAALEESAAEGEDGDEDEGEDGDEDGDDGEAAEQPSGTTVVATSGAVIPVVAGEHGEAPSAETRATGPARLIAARSHGAVNDGNLITDLQAADLFNSVGFPKGPARGGRREVAIAAVRTEYPDALTIDGLDVDATGVLSEAALERAIEETETVLNAAVDESALPGGSLLAAGGWCAPSETIYDFCELESRAGLYSLPGIRVRRGGIRHTLGPDFRSIYDNTGFCFTEQEDIAAQGNVDLDSADAYGDGGPKPCYDVPCPPFTEDRLDVCGLCITSGILQDRAYPELTRRVVRGAITAHMHRMACQKLSVVRNGSDAVAITAAGDGATPAVLSAIELQATDFRYKHRMDPNRTLEAVFPLWFLGVVRADMARQGNMPVYNVTDAMVRSWFRLRKINPQFIYNYQDDFCEPPAPAAAGQVQGSPPPQGGFGAATAITEWPSTVEFLLYTAGTWVEGRQDLITLTGVHDSTQFRANQFTALFTEEGWLVAKRCHESRRVTVDICANGVRGAMADLTCPAG